MSSIESNFPESGSSGLKFSSQGDVTIGRDATGRDKITTYIGLNVQDLVEALRKAFPKDDPRPRQIGKILEDFQSYHTALHEWKELHNALNEIINAFDPFATQVARSEHKPLRPRIYRDAWRSTNRCVINLLTWAATIRSIGAAYQPPLPNQPEQGEIWAKDIRVGTDKIMNHIERGIGFESSQTAILYRILEVGARREWVPQLYDYTCEFEDVVKRHMSHADKQLRDTATKLYELSQHMFGDKP
jgi:hypothetical protein